jgi:uncharacterized protein (DUF486 family)
MGTGQSAAFKELQWLIDKYKSVLPLWTFPTVPLTVAAVFQTLAWLSGPILFQNLSLLPRILVLWGLALLEYIPMSFSMNASVELLGMQEPLLVVIYQVITLTVFIFINIVVFRKPFATKYGVAFVLLALAVYVAYMW